MKRRGSFGVSLCRISALRVGPIVPSSSLELSTGDFTSSSSSSSRSRKARPLLLRTRSRSPNLQIYRVVTTSQVSASRALGGKCVEFSNTANDTANDLTTRRWLQLIAAHSSFQALTSNGQLSRGDDLN